MKVIGQVRPEVLTDLDAERIHLGHAYELGRVTDSDVQLRLFIQVKQYDLTVSDLQDIVQQTLDLIQQRSTDPGSHPSTTTLPPAVIKCAMCDEDRPLKDVVGVNICRYCHGIAYEAIQRKKAEATPAPQAPQEAPS
jgi:hypothetical protein